MSETNTKIKQLEIFGDTYDLDVIKNLSENDPEAVGYVKGRTHWGTNTVVNTEWSVNSGSFVVLDNASENRKDPVFVRLFDKEGSNTEYCFSLTKDTSRTFDVDPSNNQQFKISLSFYAIAGYEPGEEVFGTYSLTLAVEPESLDVWPHLVDRLFDVEVITEAERISPLFLPYTNLTQKDNGQIVISDDLNITDTLSVGYGTTATGEYSVALGYSTQASGDYSHAAGCYNEPTFNYYKETVVKNNSYYRHYWFEITNVKKRAGGGWYCDVINEGYLDSFSDNSFYFYDARSHKPP
jgi:hypothetical protein